jgi:hypothetical protein
LARPSAGTKGQKDLWQKNGGFTANAAIFLPQIFLPSSSCYQQELTG